MSFASWSYGQHLQERLGTGEREVLGAVNHGDGQHTNPRIPPASDLAHYVPYSEECHCHHTKQGPLPTNFLAIKLGSRNLDVATNSHPSPSEGWEIDMPMSETLGDHAQRQYTAAERRWITGTLTREARTSPPADHGYALVVGRYCDEPRVFGYTQMPTSWGDTLLYAAEYTKESFSKLLGGVLDGSGLLLATFTKGKRNGEVVIVGAAIGARGMRSSDGTRGVPSALRSIHDA